MRRCLAWFCLLGFLPFTGCIGNLAARGASVSSRAAVEELHAGAHPGEDSPMAGEDCAIVYDGTRHRVFLYGGKGDDDRNTNELWSFDLTTRHWSRSSGDGPQPPPREDHSLILDEPNDALVLYGGEDGPASRETWIFDLRRSRWEDITHDSAPFREDHVAIYDPKGKRMIVFGGRDDKRNLSADTWVLDLDRRSPSYRTWSVLPTSDPKPVPRSDHGAIYDSVGDRLLVFGGRQRSKTEKYLNDVWALQLRTGQWTELQTRGDAPPGIRRTAVTFDPRSDELIVFGGEVLAAMGSDKRGEELLVNLVWSLDLHSLTWTDRTPYPPPIYDHVGVFVPEYSGTLVYGGSTHRPDKGHNTWLVTHPDARTKVSGEKR